MRILIVDDVPFMRRVLKKIMEDAGHEIVGMVDNGEEGVREYKRFKPDVVTMDLTLPGMDGMEAIKLIMQYDPAAQILVTSAMGQAVIVKEAIHSGAYDFVVKPVDEKRLLSALANARVR
ncbi:MAG: chemotaxis protein CheY [Paenibacillaceae bacterium]|jgi:two-component system chemotaxis response regulator CheY|nr:chemotaxis protein CheY [Paenibacillaceae bacterium]